MPFAAIPQLLDFSIGEFLSFDLMAPKQTIFVTNCVLKYIMMNQKTVPVRFNYVLNPSGLRVRMASRFTSFSSNKNLDVILPEEVICSVAATGFFFRSLFASSFN